MHCSKAASKRCRSYRQPASWPRSTAFSGRRSDAVLEMIRGGCRIARGDKRRLPRHNVPRTTRDAPSTRSDNGPARPLPRNRLGLDPEQIFLHPAAGGSATTAGAFEAEGSGSPSWRRKSRRWVSSDPSGRTRQLAPAPPSRAASRREIQARSLATVRAQRLLQKPDLQLRVLRFGQGAEFVAGCQSPAPRML